MNQVFLPTVKGMAEDGNDYTGFLYAGLMVSPTGEIAVVEFNCRFGDPEAQPIMFRLKSDLVELCEMALNGRLDEASVDWDPRASLGVVMAAGGYPEAYNKGDVIEGLSDKPLADTHVFQAGPEEKDGRIGTAGGRVLCVCALGDTVGAAQSLAYEEVQRIHWKDVYYRTDIGHRAIARETRHKES